MDLNKKLLCYDKFSSPLDKYNSFWIANFSQRFSIIK